MICPRCKGKVFDDHGDTYCLNCGTLYDLPRAWDPVSSPGTGHAMHSPKAKCATVGCINRAHAGKICERCSEQRRLERFLASQASV